MLVENKLNVVGETHNESDLRRDEEKVFCLAKSKSANYWTEAKFPDLAGLAQVNAVGAPTADLMEYRATHGAAMLIASFDQLGDQGVGASALSGGPFVTAAAKFGTDFQAFMKIRDRLDRTWRPSNLAVDKAVQGAYDAVESACQAYQYALDHPGTELQQAKALRDFVNSRVALRDMVPALAAATGARLKDSRDATELATYMRTQRSNFMGLAAAFSYKLRGVWKVGDLHVKDLRAGSTVDLSRFNLVSKAEFEAELGA